MSLMAPTPGTMLGLAARENRRAQAQEQTRPAERPRFQKWVRLVLATVALAIGLSGFSLSSAQAWPWDDMKDNITATIMNMCGPNDVPTPSTYTGVDTMAGLNTDGGHDVRSTILPVFAEDEGGTAGGNGMERIQNVYGPYNEVIAQPTYERYGFSALSWHQYGYDCFSPSLMMGPLADMGLTVLVHVPMMISMAILNLAMDNQIYDAFATMMQPFIGAMYQLFNPWIYMIVPVGVLIAWLASRGSIQATLKAAGWGVFILAVFLLMGSSTTTIVSKATNIVTEVSGTAACKLNAAAGDDTSGDDCSTTDPIKSVNQALWYGIPYQTWHLGQVGERQAELDSEARENGEVGWGPAILNGQYVGVNIDGEIDEQGRDVISATETWNQANYTPDSDSGKVALWAEESVWNQVPYLGNIKMMCNDVGGTGENDREPSENTRWMYSGNDGTNNYCDTASAGTTEMVSYVQGNEFNQQFLTALAGMVGVGAVSLTVIVASIYLGVQKMLFFFLLFLAPMVLLVSALGDRKRRPFAIRFAELLGANLLKQIAAVCIVLFVAHAMASLFGSATFGSVPWIMKPYVAFLFFIALALLAFPLKNLVKGAVQGDTSALDKQANAPVRAAKNTAKGAGIVTAVAATGGAALAAGGGTALAAGAGGKAAMAGKAGSALTQAGKVMGHGSKAGKAMRAGGGLMRASQSVMDSRHTAQGRKSAVAQSAQSLLTGKGSEKYRDQEGNFLPNATKMAQKDAQKMAESGQKTDKATKAQDAYLASFFNGYRKENGEHHKLDPNSPQNLRNAQAQKEQERRQAKTDADKAASTGAASGAPAGASNANQPGSGTGPQSGFHTAPDTSGNGRNTQQGTTSDRNAAKESASTGDGSAARIAGAAAAGAATNGASAHSQGTDGSTDAQGSDAHSQASLRQAQEVNYQRFAEQAKANLNGPSFAREMEYNVNTVRSGADVLSQAGLSQEQVTSNPTLLLSGEAYDGGSTAKMDPFHPATGAMNQLRFAASSGDEEAMERAVDQASDAVAQHGVPNQVSGVSSIGERAQNFESVQLVGAMPNLSENASWQERADAAHTMMAAQVAMPETFPAREAVQNYTDALTNPGVDVASLAALKESTIAQIAESTSDVSPDLGGSTPAAAAAGVAAGGVAGAAFSGESAPADPTAPEAPQTHPAPTPGAASEPTAAYSEPQAPQASTPSLASYEPSVPNAAPSPSGETPRTDGGASADAPSAAYREEPQGSQEPSLSSGYSSPAPAEPAAPTHSEPAAPQEPAAPTYSEPAASPDAAGSGRAETSAASEAYQGPSDGGVSREDLRDAVSSGLREARLEYDAGNVANMGGHAPAAPAEANPAEAAPTEVHSSGGSDIVEPASSNQPEPTSTTGAVSGGAPRARSESPQEPTEEAETVEPMNDQEPLVYRPGKRRRKRSGLFDEPADDDSQDGDD